ncbi:MAG: CehA/McbA family metallohydrolase [Pseudomonadota bacterium]|nr:CehA/McbA family metallohydrolase [Pseudomonadota bacterium]
MFVTLLLLGCTPDPTPILPGPIAVGEGLFLNGCPQAGRAGARTLTDLAEVPWGPDALAAPGDVLLLNERVAFVIQGPDDPRTYYHYGGMPIDAVAVSGCAQAGPERFGEMGLVVGQLDLADFSSSSMHMIRGDSVEIVSDGSDGGPAIVDVHGTDDRFWLVELTLMRRVYEGGGRKLLGDLYGLDLTLRYTLEPGESVLQLDVLLGGEPITDGFLVGSVVFPSDYTENTAYASGELSVGGIGFDVGVAWTGDGSDGGSSAIAMPGGTLARTEIAGVSVLVDVNQVAEPLVVGDEAAFAIAVGATDAASAAAGLESHLDDPVPGFATAWHDLGGAVVDPSGNPVPGALIEVASPDDSGEWSVLTTLVTDAGGRFSGRTLAIEGAWRVQASGAGRDDGEAMEVAPEAAGALSLPIGAVGGITVAATDGEGNPLPVRVELERDDGYTTSAYPTPQDPDVPVAPGHYTAWLSRGYEHALVTTEIDVPADGTATLAAELPLVVDTSGWASYDSHVHSGPSADSQVLPVDRMRTAAASGLDLVISTDHEAIIDLSGALTDAGVDEWLLYALGSEITASLPEHTNAWPFPETPDVRGDPVRWYDLAFGGIYAAERERGADVVQLNHSRVNDECGILCILDWDRLSDPPAMDDPEALGLTPGTAVWSWDFDSFELLNGLRSPYLEPDDPRHSGALLDWLAFHNLGYRVTAVGVTDEHGMDTPGTPRTYVAVPDDAAAVVEDFVAGTLGGAAQVSAGAFARVTVDGAGPGETALVTDGEADLSLHVEALAEIDVTRVEVLVNCDAAWSIEATDPSGVVKLDETRTLPVGGDLYVVVLAIGADAMPRGLSGYAADEVPRVIVNPIFVDGDGDGVWTPPGPKACDWSP